MVRESADPSKVPDGRTRTEHPLTTIVGWVKSETNTTASTQGEECHRRSGMSGENSFDSRGVDNRQIRSDHRMRYTCRVAGGGLTFRLPQRGVTLSRDPALVTLVIRQWGAMLIRPQWARVDPGPVGNTLP
jgi:hypothetical protein